MKSNSSVAAARPTNKKRTRRGTCGGRRNRRIQARAAKALERAVLQDLGHLRITATTAPPLENQDHTEEAQSRPPVEEPLAIVREEPPTPPPELEESDPRYWESVLSPSSFNTEDMKCFGIPASPGLSIWEIDPTWDQPTVPSPTRPNDAWTVPPRTPEPDFPRILYSMDLGDDLTEFSTEPWFIPDGNVVDPTWDQAPVSPPMSPTTPDFDAPRVLYSLDLGDGGIQYSTEPWFVPDTWTTE